MDHVNFSGVAVVKHLAFKLSFNKENISVLVVQLIFFLGEKKLIKREITNMSAWN